MRHLLVSLSIAALLVVPGIAAAQEAAPEAPVSASGPNTTGISGWAVLGFGWGSAIGVGGRYMMPLMDKGLLNASSVKDRLALEFGADLWTASWSLPFFGDYRVTTILPVAGAAWTFWFNERFALYPKLDLGWRVSIVTSNLPSNAVVPGHSGLFIDGAAGVLYKLDSLTARLELGSGTMKAGVGFGF